MVVPVMQFTMGRHLLSRDWAGFSDQGGCASGDSVDAGHNLFLGLLDLPDLFNLRNSGSPNCFNN